jgi:hypothetical protein
LLSVECRINCSLFAEGGRQDDFFGFAFFTAEKGKGRRLKEELQQTRLGQLVACELLMRSQNFAVSP